MHDLQPNILLIVAIVVCASRLPLDCRFVGGSTVGRLLLTALIPVVIPNGYERKSSAGFVAGFYQYDFVLRQ